MKFPHVNDFVVPGGTKGAEDCALSKMVAPVLNLKPSVAASASASQTSMRKRLIVTLVEDHLHHFSDVALVRNISINNLSNQAKNNIPLVSGNMVSSNGPLDSVPSASKITKRNILAANDRLGSSGMV
ncbi:hypothetical protein JHK86_012432 [Glycine max]|nr:hypothetical protein JHK86_012432 [Glycine max]